MTALFCFLKNFFWYKIQPAMTFLLHEGIIELGTGKERERKTAMRQERFKMEREGLVKEGQEVEISERSPGTGRYTYLVEPSVAMSGIYRTNERIKARKGRIARIEHTQKGFYLVVEVEE